MEKVSWKAGAQFPVKAETAASTIRSLQASLGQESITAQELLDASRDEDSPLHDCFEWDDTVAAEKYRLWQARHIINSLEIEIVSEDKPAIKTRLFLNIERVAPKSKGEFVGVDVVLGNRDYRNRVLSYALSELRAFQRKYSAYEELMGVCKAIDAFADTVK